MSTALPIYRWLVPASARDDAHADHAKLVAAKRDPRLARVAWRDLMPLARWEIIDELCLSLPWLAASLAFAAFALWPAAMVCSFMFFLAALRQIHNGTHYALGIGKRGTEWFLFAMSIALLGSNHAVQYNHLRHHRDCLGPEDVEGVNARLPAWQVLLCGPVYPLMQHWWALSTSNPRMRRWVAAELAANASWIAAVVFWIEWRPLQYHVAFTAAGHCFTAFFAGRRITTRAPRHFPRARRTAGSRTGSATGCSCMSSIISSRRCRRAISRRSPRASKPRRRDTGRARCIEPLRRR
jgi:hypothetical protein